MESALRDSITEERLAAYRRRMEQSHATPFVCVAVGHAPGPNEGEFVVCCLEDMDMNELLKIMRNLCRSLEYQIESH